VPNIFFYGPKMTKEQKAELVKRFTEVAQEVTKVPAPAFVVNIHESDPENVGVGGVLLADRHHS
jgi:4-oxalocrotonate tautomerase